MSSSFRHRLTLMAILLGGTALRLYRLGADSLWYDETVSTYLAGSPLPELIRHTAGDIHPPGYYMLLRGWLLLAGYPTGRADPHGIGLEFMAGVFSLFAGVLLIALVYRLARLFAAGRVALIAAALVALSPYHIWYSQEVRMYTLAAGLGVVALYALLRAIDIYAAPAATADEKLTQRRKGAKIRSLPGVLASWRETGAGISTTANTQYPIPAVWWLVYALAAAAGMYTLYYFVFLLIPLNLWALLVLVRRKADSHATAASRNTQYAVRHPPSARRPSLLPLLLANGVAALLYAPWLPIAYRQAINPPVPPWRTAPALWAALRESWTALSLGQSAPPWLWPALVLTLALYGLGLFALTQDRRTNQPPNQPTSQPANQPTSQLTNQPTNQPPNHPTNKSSAIRYSPFAHPLILPLAVFGPLLLILLISAITPLYHVRYLFTYSPAFTVVLAVGAGWLWQRSRAAFGVAALAWLAAAGVTLHAFWADPLYRADDHRTAVRFLREQWRPGDVVLVNAGWAYTALITYWDGPVAGRSRLTEPLPSPRADAALVAVTTGHMDGAPGLGWGDPRSDFFALPSATAQTQIAGLFDRFARVWHYRIYDTVNDPAGQIRAWLATGGLAFEERAFSGEANMRLQGFLSPGRIPEPTWPSAAFEPGLTVRAGPLPRQLASGETLYPVLDWQADVPVADFATSVRLVAADGTTWAQGTDEPPSGPLYPASRWPAGATVRQTAALPIPPGTPPGTYEVELVVYDPASGKPWPARPGGLTLSPNGVRLGQVTVVRPDPPPAAQPAIARFGPLALIEATSPATTIAAGGQVPVELLWQAAEAPLEPLVIVVQLLAAGDRVVANLEEEPLGGRYPTPRWSAGELVRDRHTLSLPPGVPRGEYRLVVGVYRAADRARLKAKGSWLQASQYATIKRIDVK